MMTREAACRFFILFILTLIFLYQCWISLDRLLLASSTTVVSTGDIRADYQPSVTFCFYNSDNWTHMDLEEMYSEDSKMFRDDIRSASFNYGLKG